MKNVASHGGVSSKSQLLAEIDRLSAEIRVMLDDSLRRTEEAKKMQHHNDLLFAELGHQIEVMQRECHSLKGA